MEFYCISISHRTSSLAEREKLSCAQPEIQAALADYAEHPGQFLGPVSEIAILSTCNRFEVYLTFRGDNHPFVGRPDRVRQVMLSFIAQAAGYSGSDLDSQAVMYQDLAAVEHLFRVSAGLESQVVGEAQIIGQVADALQIALQAGSARHVLASLFRAALHTAKRAHTETAVGRNPASLSSVAASIAEQAAGIAEQQRILLVGAGEMSRLAARAFHARGAKNITIVNRTLANAVRLAGQYGCKARPWEELEDALQSADVVLSATGAPEHILTEKMLRVVMERRPGLPLLLLDIALPRDIDPAARAIPGVLLFDLDDMKQRLNQSIDHRQKEAQQVEAIVLEELHAFGHWIEVMPTIGKLHRKAELIRQKELDRTLHHLPDIDPLVRDQVELLTRSLVKKLFHEPSHRMRKSVNQDELALYKESLHFLFGLDEKDASPGDLRENGYDD